MQQTNSKQTQFINFTFFGDYLSNIQDLPVNEQNEVIVAIVRYTSQGQTPEFSKPYLKTIFNCIKFSLDKSISSASRGQGRKSNENQTEIKSKSNGNQNEIKLKSNGNQTQNNKNIEQEHKEKITKKKNFGSIDDITEAEIKFVASFYGTSTSFVSNSLDDLRNYCDSKGKRYKNYLAALRNFVKNDLEKGNRGSPPPTFRQKVENQDLLRQQEIMRTTPKKIGDEAEFARIRSMVLKSIKEGANKNQIRSSHE
ncbi:hypothetical protein IJJ27_04370 [bacterium]|nr:hypothetical protein [bacterium]